MRKSEPELYKDKIEVSLDGRQIFYLFFGGAVIACLLFVLGVMVGKRVEARSHVGRIATTAARDPLAALDQLDATSRGAQLSFQKALSGVPAPVGQVEKAVAELDRVQADEPALLMPPEEHGETVPARVDKVADKAAEKAPDKVADKAPEKAEAPRAPAKEVAKARAAAPVSRPDPKARYTLQLSSFQDRGEAEAFMGTLSANGYRAYISESKVDGKGTFYRVRFGGYGSYEEAVAAKADFESKIQRIAYVTKL
jgi:DedD protein